MIDSKNVSQDIKDPEQMTRKILIAKLDEKNQKKTSKKTRQPLSRRKFMT